MKPAFFLAPAGRGQGLTTVALGLVVALDRRGVRVSFYKPISEDRGGESRPERSTHFLRATTTLAPADPLSLVEATKLVSSGRLDELLGKVVGTFEKSTQNADLAILEGLLPSPDDPYRGSLNRELVKTLNGQVILVMGMAGRSVADLDDQIEYAAKIYGGIDKILGLILNRCPIEDGDEISNYLRNSRLFPRGDRLIGVIPHNELLTFCRAIDVQRHLNATVIYPGEMESRRVKSMSMLARTVPNLLHTLTPGAMLVTPADRSDVILAVSMAALSRVPLSGLILTGDTDLDNRIVDFCGAAFATGLPLFRVMADS
ncbi:MAG TPA: DRTGG domain-containing protein, partial [Chthoniobacterales bacterium]|nr:DRTGG domain-containing protein [Chthoniobacterales bacterium]